MGFYEAVHPVRACDCRSEGIYGFSGKETSSRPSCRTEIPRHADTDTMAIPDATAEEYNSSTYDAGMLQEMLHTVQLYRTSPSFDRSIELGLRLLYMQ